MGKVVVISGSPSKTSRLYGAIDYVISSLEKQGFLMDHIEAIELPAEDLLHANFGSLAIKAANELVEQADAIIIATPVYKASYTGILKAYLDLIPQNGLVNKPILPIAMGGTIAHLLMIEYALKPVLSVLGATQIENGVFVQDNQVVRSEQGTFNMSEEVMNRLTLSLDNFTMSLSSKVTV